MLVDPVAMFFADASHYLTTDGVSVRGFFSAPLKDAFGMLAGIDPLLTCLSSEVTLSLRGKILIINGINYTIREIDPDGYGLSILKLEAV